MGHADPEERARPVFAEAEPQARLEIVDRAFGLPWSKPDEAAVPPTISEAGVECPSTVHQIDGGVDVLAKIT
jgi:hypothetical protein